MDKISKFEEYKLFVEDTARFTDRRQTVNNTYVAVNSIVLTAITFLAKDVNSTTPLWQFFTVMLVLSAGIFICLQWERLIYTYKKLCGLRFRELREMEEIHKELGFHGMYHKEDELYPRDKNNKMIRGKGLNISDRERWLPWVFIVMYGLFLLGSLTLLLSRLISAIL